MLGTWVWRKQKQTLLYYDGSIRIKCFCLILFCIDHGSPRSGLTRITVQCSGPQKWKAKGGGMVCRWGPGYPSSHPGRQGWLCSSTSLKQRVISRWALTSGVWAEALIQFANFLSLYLETLKHIWDGISSVCSLRDWAQQNSLAESWRPWLWARNECLGVKLMESWGCLQQRSNLKCFNQNGSKLSFLLENRLMYYLRSACIRLNFIEGDLKGKFKSVHFVEINFTIKVLCIKSNN